MSWGELLKLAACVKLIIVPTSEKRGRPEAFKDLLNGFLQICAVQRKASLPARAMTLPQGASPHWSGGGWGRLTTVQHIRAKTCQGPAPCAREPGGRLPAGAEWWLGRHPCRSMGSSSAMHRHSVWLRGASSPASGLLTWPIPAQPFGLALQSLPPGSLPWLLPPKPGFPGVQLPWHQPGST